MNGLRSNPPRSGAANQSDRSSLDALNRTIEGLEARIEGLMGSVGREPRGRSTAEREPAPRPLQVPQAVPVAIQDIMDRQRSLNAGRDRSPPRRDEAAYPEKAAAEREPVRDASSVQARFDRLRSDFARGDMPAAREPLAREPAREPLRSPAVAEPALRADPAMAEIAKALVGLRQELKNDIAEGLSREMGTLRAEMRGITADVAQDQTAAIDIRTDLQRLSDSIHQLGRQASPAQADALKVEFDELRAMIDGLAREDSVRRMEDRWTGVEDRLNVFDNSRDDELVALAYRLDEIKSQIGTMNSGPALHALEDKLISVAQAIELIGRHMQPDDRRMASQFADLDARLDEISRAIVASGRSASASETAGVSRMESRLSDLSRQIDGLSHPSDGGLAARIEALTARVEDLAGEEAAVRLEERLGHLSTLMERAGKASAQPDLTGYLSDISRKIDALDQGSVNDALADRLDDLARRIDTLVVAAPVAAFAGEDRFARLEDQLTDIASRLEETHAAPQDDSEILRSLQDQIANLSSLVSQPREPAILPAAFENRMNALEDYLATSDEYIIEAARQAAEAVMDAYARNGMAQSTSAGGSDMAAISALADDLKVLEQLSRSSEERTARTFDTLHETLVHIADKLERLEERGFREEEPRAFGERSAPPMPRATQPVFALEEEDPFHEVDFRNQYEALKRDMQTSTADIATLSPSRSEVADAVSRQQVSVDALMDGAVEDALRAPEHAAVAPLADRTAPVVKRGLLAGLTKRFSRQKEPTPQERQTVEPTPSIDPSETMAPDVANLPLEPGSGVPDVKKILERVRAGQSARAAQGGHPGEADKADFIAAARRAAKLAAEEVDTINRGQADSRGKNGTVAPAKGGFARHRRQILIAVGAVLLAIMAYPLVNTMLRGEGVPATAPVAAIEAPADAVPQPDSPPPAAPVGEDAVAPLSTLQPQSDDSVVGQPADILPELENPATGADPSPQTEQAAPTATAGFDTIETDGSSADMLEPATNAGAQAGFAAGSAPVAADTFAPVEKQQASVPTAVQAPAESPAKTPVVVPAEITPPALAQAAAAGDSMAMFEIGAVYTEGRGVKADMAKAAEWYQRATDAGVVPAQYRLASLYEKGTGVPRDPAKAKALYEAAAQKGNISAMHNLAVMLANGADAAPDFTGAGKWFTLAAEHGVRDSQFNLAILYARGNGVSQNLEESYKWFAAAARDGDTDAAQKRDEVEKAMSPEQLKAAKAKFESWTATPADDKANSTAVPDTWTGKGTKTSSVDMKKALRNIQAILNNNGFDAGKPDGEMGQKTIAAIKSFQTSIGQQPTGQITDALVKELLKRNG